MERASRCTRRIGWWAVLLLGAAALPPAQADLRIERTAVQAWTELIEPVQLRSPRQHAVWQLGQPPGPMTAVAADRTATLAAAARQTPDGFFQSVVTHQRGWEDSSGLRLATAGTQFSVTVTTNQPDTPLVLDFLFLGSQLQAGAHYGAGRLAASATLLISAAISAAPFPVVTPVWGFEDRLLLDTRDAFDPASVVEHDTQRIGLPTAHASAGWTNFESWAVHDRDPMIGTLDFGLLQPGQFFALTYFSAVQIEAETTYLGHAHAEVIDPFSLRDDPPLQLQLSGLVLPTPVGVVPEPASIWLMLAGAGLLAAARTLRRRPAHTPAVLVALGALLGPTCARADAEAVVTGVVINARPGIFSSESDSVSGSGTARVSDSQQVTSASGAALGWVAGAWGSTRRGAAGAEIVADRGTLATRAQISATGVVSDTLHIDGSRPGVAVFSAGVFGSFNSLSGTRFLADGTLMVSGPGGAESADVRFEWTKQIGSLRPSVVATEGATGINLEPASLSATLHVPLLVNPGDDVTVALHVNVFVEPGINDHAVANFGHTMQLAIALPDGLSYTSASGDFMVEAQPLPVPEPSGWLLWLAGLVAVLRSGWRHSRSTQGGLKASKGAWQVSTTSVAAAGLMLPMLATAGASTVTHIDFIGSAGHGVASGQAEVTRELTGTAASVEPGLAGEWYSLGHAHANDQTGVLGATSLMHLRGNARHAAPPMGSSASISGTLHFTGTRGGLVTLSMDVFGAFGIQLPYENNVTTAGFINFGSSHAGVEYQWRGPAVSSLVAVTTEGDVHVASQHPAGLAAQLHVSQFMDPGDTMGVSAGLNTAIWRAASGAAVVVDFGHTARISLQLPEGLELAPVAGGFLQLAPVPEPATWAMLAGGLFLLLPVLRARRRLAAAGAAAAVLPALLLVGTPPASAQSAHAAVWNSSNFNNRNPAANLRSEEVNTGRANVGHSALTNPFIDRVEWVAGASADLRRGSVGVEIQADRVGNPASTQGDTVWALGELNETLTFTGSRPGVVDFALGISGSFQSIDGSAFRADGFLFAGGLSGQLDFHWVNNLSSPHVSVFASPGTTGIRSDPTGLFGTLHLLRLVQPGETLALQLRMELRVGPGAYDHAVANFGHTAQLGITLPEGMSFTSASGDFMVDAPPLPVPEPASAWLLLAGLGLLWVCGRRSGPGHRQMVLPALFASCLAALPAASQAQASASVTLSGIATPFQLDADISQPERATALLSGGGALVGLSDDIAGHADFLVGASADLARGTLRGFAQLNIVGQGTAETNTNAGLFDTLVFEGTRPVPLHLRLAVHGAFFDSGSNLQEVVARLRVGSQAEQATLTWFGWPHLVQHNRPVRVQGGQAISTEAANTIVWLTIDQMVMPGVPVDVVAQLLLHVTAGADSQVNVNFGNTAQLWLQVPDDITYTSVSGRFLTAAPVPEPGSTWLLLAGLPLLGAMLRRRRA